MQGDSTVFDTALAAAVTSAGASTSDPWAVSAAELSVVGVAVLTELDFMVVAATETQAAAVVAVTPPPPSTPTTTYTPTHHCSTPLQHLTAVCTPWRARMRVPLVSVSIELADRLAAQALGGGQRIDFGPGVAGSGLSAHSIVSADTEHVRDFSAESDGAAPAPTPAAASPPPPSPVVASAVATAGISRAVAAVALVWVGA